MAAEKQFEEKVKDFLKGERRCWFIKYWGGGAYTRAGVPDLLVCSCGQFMGIELKADKGEPTLLQLHQLQEVRDAGGWGILLYPGEFGAFRKWFSSRVRNRAFYQRNVEAQEKWKKKLMERSIKDGSEEEGTAGAGSAGQQGAGSPA